MRFRRLSLTALAVAFGVLNAHRLWWTSDDAYISFRYAANLVHGLGLVYNPGERVEGYSNFLWTLWCALGLRLGKAPEIWANAAGLACYGATLWLLGAHAARRAGRLGDASWTIPWAALIGAVHRDWAVFATGGLETAQFTLFATASYFALIRTGESAEGSRPAATRWAAASGVLLALTCLSRPDGIVFAAFGSLYLLWIARRAPRVLATFLIPLGALVAAYAAWKLSYYGDLRPNTYYAKSADRAWWSQGVFYVRLYLRRYVPVAPLFGIALGAIAIALRPRPSRAPAVAGPARPLDLGPPLLALAFGWGYAVYVARVGGDFMFARFMIPATPFLALVLEEGLVRLAVAGAEPGRRRVFRGAAIAIGVVSLGAIVWLPSPVSGAWSRHGIVDERAYYLRPERDTTYAAARDLRDLFLGVPVRVAIVGADAVVAYVANPREAIEAETGLTDRFIAHQPLGQRGRVGHEKHAPYSYLIDVRRAHLVLRDLPAIEDSVRAHVPLVRFRYGAATGLVLAWEAPVMDELRRRGATFTPEPPAPR